MTGRQGPVQEGGGCLLSSEIKCIRVHAQNVFSLSNLKPLLQDINGHSSGNGIIIDMNWVNINIQTIFLNSYSDRWGKLLFLYLYLR